MNVKSSPSFWWVNQGTTYDEARKRGFIWAPQESKAGRPLFHWENVSKVRSGDVIFHYADGNLRAVSRAKSDGYEAKKELGGAEWSDDGWRVDTDYCVLANPIPIQAVGFKIAALHLNKGPVNKTGGVNQGYLFELTADAAALLIAAASDDPALVECGISRMDKAAQDLDESALVDSRISQMKIAEHPGSVPNRLCDLATTFAADLEASSIRANKILITRFISALLSKRFMILTGLAGSGKTKLAQAFARWISPDSGLIGHDDSSKGKAPSPYHVLIPVGADWTGNENIVGYPDGLQEANYVTKPALELIRHALELENAQVAHFLILDEMNLSHVERYFADLLSAVESGEAIPLYEGSERGIGGAEGSKVPRKLPLPENLFIIGTVNVDETTYMFSPKVLDRANVIEFCVEPDEMTAFLAAPKAPSLETLDGRGSEYGSVFVQAAADRTREVPVASKSAYEAEMLRFFNLLREHNAEFGYRTAYEAARFVHFYKLLGGYSDEDTAWFRAAMDAVIVQKFLPKLHGSRSKMEGLLWALAWACGPERIERYDKDFAAQVKEAGRAEDEAKYAPNRAWELLQAKNADNPALAAYYPLSFDKIMRMWRKLVRDQFVSFAEA
jgi:5-methylcytosine-specific restriction enzyme B